jgi:hypothetical protein
MSGPPSLDFLLRDLGYSATSSPLTIRAVFKYFSGIAGVQPQNSSSSTGIVISEDQVARVLSMMCRMHVGLAMDSKVTPDILATVYAGLDYMNELKKMQTWNVDVFVSVAYESVSYISVSYVFLKAGLTFL